MQTPIEALAPVVEQVQWLRSGELSPTELVDLYLSRIDRFDQQLGSYFTVLGEVARADAQQKTAQLEVARRQDRVQELPFLLGIPTTIKDLNALAGFPVTYGVAALREQIAELDDGVVQLIKRSGLIILGKTALSQLASWPYSEPPGFPPSRNPWNLDYTSGGSSGGAAAAVAAGLCSVAHGSDGGGSIRGPAFCCGVVGIKPSRGRVSSAPVGDSLGGMGTHGTLGRTVADAAALLDAIALSLPGDPYSLPLPAEPFRVTAQRLADLPKGLNVGVATTLQPFEAADPICKAAVVEVAHLLEATGAIIEAVDLDCTALIEPFKLVWRSEVAAAGLPTELLEPMNQWLLSQASSAGDYIRARQQLQVLARQWVEQLQTYDAIVLPTYLSPPIPVGAWQDLLPEGVMERIAQWIAPCPWVNVTGQPAIALPTGFTPTGLPVGIQLIGRLGEESRLIAIAAYLEHQLKFPYHKMPFGRDGR